MEITIHLSRILPVAIGLFIYCIALDAYIWHMNRRWLKKHPKQARHPYSPLFTAIGNIGLTIALGILTHWQIAAVLLILNIVFGGLMWLLHGRRWMFRS